MLKNRKLATLIGLSILLVAFLTPGLASAHEKRAVGKYTFVVGFLDEPAYAGVKNSLDLTICDGNACNYSVKDGARTLDNPVNDAQKSLKAEVSFGGQAPLPLDLAARYGNPGKYAGYFLPAKVGAYTFHITGQLNGQAIDEKFTSSPTTFGEAEQLKTYPASDAASNPDALQAQVKEAKDSAGSATIFGLIGIGIGVIGLVMGGLALVSRRSVSQTEAVAPPEPVGSRRG